MIMMTKASLGGRWLVLKWLGDGDKLMWLFSTEDNFVSLWDKRVWQDWSNCATALLPRFPPHQQQQQQQRHQQEWWTLMPRFSPKACFRRINISTFESMLVAVIVFFFCLCLCCLCLCCLPLLYCQGFPRQHVFNFVICANWAELGPLRWLSG